MTTFVHAAAICESVHVGAGTRIWAFAHVLPLAHIGRDCNICDHVFIENDVVVGDRVTIKSGVQLWDGLRIDDDVFVGPNCTFANDKFPRSKVHPERFPLTRIGPGASIGANATILPGIQIGRHAMIGAGSVVTGNVPPHAQVFGNPARIVGYVGHHVKIPSSDAGSFDAITQEAPNDAPSVRTCSVPGVTIHRLKRVEDLRGALTVGDFPQDVPFVPKRYFIVHDVPGKEVRGEHALRTCHQFLTCVKGGVAIVVDDGDNREEVFLGGSSAGIYVPPSIWTVQYRYTADACLLVFASAPYDPADYIRDYDEFLSVVRPETR